MLKNRLSIATLAALSLYSIVNVAAQPLPPPANLLKHWKDVENPAALLSASFLGGAGDEWLVSGGFQPDGTVVLVGNVNGGKLELGVPAAVIGTDQPTAAAQPRPVPQLDAKGKQKVNKEGQPQWEMPSWRHATTTGFIARLSPDLKKLLFVHRLPWTAGSITSAAVDAEGNIYIAGRATENIGKLGGQVAELKIDPAAERKSGACDHTFVAKLAPDASRAAWVRHARGFSEAPQLTLTTEGKLILGAQDYRTLDATGETIKAVVVPYGVSKRTSVSPIDGSMVAGGEHHWQTGREPWRCPTLDTFKPDGTMQYKLYDWGGPYVGLDNSRLVSDTAVRLVGHDRAGNILIHCWSDGGNSVATKQPTDVRSSVGYKGLGITAAGAGVLSAAYVVKIDPREMHVKGWTIWLAFTGPNKPNSVWIDTMRETSDGSLAFAGRSALGLWQTKNKLTEAPPSGEYVAVLNDDFSGVRFCSIVPGTGVCEVDSGSSDRGSSWGIVSGTVNGKPRALFLGSAVEESESYGQKVQTPAKDALQTKFGGGNSDGYFVLLDLSSAGGTAESSVAAPPEMRIGEANFVQAAPRIDPKKPAAKPAEGTVFHFQESWPKWVTVDAEFRDVAGKMWPQFFSGKPVSGSFKYFDLLPAANFTVACTTACQSKGDQSRRVLGELFSADGQPPKIALTLTSLGPVMHEAVRTVDGKGKEQVKAIEYRLGDGVLEIGEKKLKVTPKITTTYHGPKDSPVDQARISAWLTLNGQDLGLKSSASQGPIDVRLSMSGTTQTAPPPKKK